MSTTTRNPVIDKEVFRGKKKRPGVTTLNLSGREQINYDSKVSEE
jgi:hypothetical protein